MFSGDKLYDDIDYDNGSTLEKDIQVGNFKSLHVKGQMWVKSKKNWYKSSILKNAQIY